MIFCIIFKYYYIISYEIIFKGYIIKKLMHVFILLLEYKIKKSVGSCKLRSIHRFTS